MSSFIWQYPAVVTRVIDGDTIEMDVSFAKEDTRKDVAVRVEGINALELREKFGSEARDAAARLLPVGTPVTLLHHKRDQYGRLSAKIVLPDTSDFGTRMLLALASDGVTHLAKPYLT